MAITNVSATAPSASHPLRAPLRWVVTVVATGISVISLDLMATAVGVMVVTSHVLDGVTHELAIGLLAVTYLLWAGALGKNVVANWRLLELTGACTNLPSKVMFEVARRRSSSARVSRVATAAGYIVTEIAKEAPYYAGAFGTALVSDAVDSTDALIFLAGTNIGAAVYEYGLAALSNTFLNRRTRRSA